MRVGYIRYFVGPLAIAGFFLPWTHGPGVLAATEFSGFSLVGYTGLLQALDLPLAAAATLWLVRLLVLATVVAGAWQAVLAPWHRWHAAYVPSGWYLAGFAALAASLGLLRSGLVVPPAGLALMMAAGGAFVACQAAAPLARALARARQRHLPEPALALAEAVL